MADTIVLPYNDVLALEALFAEHGSSIAAVLVEPIAANMGLVAPKPGFLETIRAVAREGTTIILITHHVEEIIPEIGHVVFLDRGRVSGEGPTAEMLTAARLTALFGAPVSVSERNGYYTAHA